MNETSEETLGLVECAKAVASTWIFQMRFTNQRLIITEIAKKHWGWNFLGPLAFIQNGIFRGKVAQQRRMIAALSTPELLAQYPHSLQFTPQQIKSISPRLAIDFADGKKDAYMLSELVQDPLLIQTQKGVTSLVERFFSGHQ